MLKYSRIVAGQLLVVHSNKMLAQSLKKTMHTTFQRYASTAVKPATVVYDPLQEAALKENCFLVDKFDKVTGYASKKECHLVRPDGSIPLHRAFSVFLFNSRGDLLLQKRSSSKITYPDCYTNSCCSHPIQDVPGEEAETNAIGVIRAAQRRLNYELGINVAEIPTEKFSYLTRIHYLDNTSGKWGEHEIDYILFLQADVKVNPNSNEISEISYVPRNELNAFIPTLNAPLTPWFNLILKHRLKLWWDNLDDLEQFKDHENIIRLL